MEGQVNKAELLPWKVLLGVVMIALAMMTNTTAVASDATTEWMWSRRNPDYFQPDLCRSYHYPLPRRYYGESVRDE